MVESCISLPFPALDLGTLKGRRVSFAHVWQDEHHCKCVWGWGRGGFGCFLLMPFSLRCRTRGFPHRARVGCAEHTRAVCEVGGEVWSWPLWAVESYRVGQGRSPPVVSRMAQEGSASTCQQAGSLWMDWDLCCFLPSFPFISCPQQKEWMRLGQIPQ